jgi:hypothetical protein
MSTDPRVWVVLRLQFEAAHARRPPWLTYRDSTGVRMSPSSESQKDAEKWERRPIGPPIAGRRRHVLVPVDLERRLGRLEELLPPIEGPHVHGPSLIPVFIDVSAATASSAAWEEELLDFARDLPRVWALPLARPSHWVRRPPFRLPFRIAAVGRAESMLEELHETSWIRGLGELEEYAVVLDPTPYERLAESLAEGAYDIVISDRDDVADVTAASARVPSATRPRLLIAAARYGIRVGETPPLPPGFSRLVLPAQDDPALLHDVVTALVHDLPLHDAVAEISRTRHLGSSDISLVSDPLGINALRLSDSHGSLLRASLELEPIRSLGTVESFLARLPAREARPVRRRLQRAAKSARDAIEVANALPDISPVEYGRESEGLYSLAEGELGLARAQEVQSRLDATLRGLTADLRASAILREHQQRSVDIALTSTEQFEFLPRSTVLAGRRAYQLLARIGGSFPQSLLETAPPDIGPLLPDPPDEHGHDLEFALFPMDFKLHSPSIYPVSLPLFGGSEIALFTIETPPVAHDEELTAEARLAVYHQNHLIQSFLIRARVALDQALAPDGDRGVVADLDFSRTERFENVESLAPRAVSLAINHSGSATHRLLIKGLDAAQDFSFTEDMLEGDIKRFRAALEKATSRSPNVPRFPNDPAPGSTARAEAEDFIRQLAREGSRLHRELALRSNNVLYDALRAFGDKRDLTIQIIRYDPNYALPWAALYDFRLPKAAGAPVCLGTTTSGEPCTHGPFGRPDTYCIYGFWGVRHRVEQFLEPPGGNAHNPPSVQAPTTHPPALIALGVEDPSTKDLIAALDGIAPKFARRLGPDDDLLGLVWETRSRPAFVVVVGHLDDASDLPRIVLSPTTILDGDAIHDQAWDHGRLEDPRPLVLLMACGSTATELATHAGLSLSISSAGAVAVVGTEATVFTGLVGRFVHEVLTDLWTGSSLGEAVTEFRRRLLRACNPLAFVFTPFGDSDLKVVHP